MTLTQLRYFCAICEHKSINKAASMLYVSQPSISAAIKELENELGCKLFLRYKSRLVLTKEGELFFDGAQKILQSCEGLVLQIRNYQRPAQQIRLGIIPILGSALLPPVTKLFQQIEEQHPEYHFEVVEQNNAVILQALDNSAIDLAITNLNSEIEKKYTVYMSRKLPFKAYMSRGNPLSEHCSLSIEQIKDIPLITSTVRSTVSQAIVSWYECYGYKPNFKFRVSQMSSIQSYLKNDFGIFLSHWDVGPCDPDIIGISLNDSVTVAVGLIGKKYVAMDALIANMVEKIKYIPPFLH